MNNFRRNMFQTLLARMKEPVGFSHKDSSKGDGMVEGAVPASQESAEQGLAGGVEAGHAGDVDELG